MRIRILIKLSVFILIFLFVLILSSTFQEAKATCRIKNISLKKEGNFTQVCVYADKPFEFVHFTEKAKDQKPYRIVIDCKDAIFDLPQRNFMEGLPSGTIKSIRTSQFQIRPEKIVRVVLDLNGPAVYKVIDSEGKKTATIAILTSHDPDFPMWMADKKGKKRKSTGSTGAVSLTGKSSKQPKVRKHSVQLTGSENLSPGTPFKKQEVSPPEEIYRRALCYADTGEKILSLEKKQFQSSQIKSVDKGIEKKRAKKPEISPVQLSKRMKRGKESAQIAKKSTQASPRPVGSPFDSANVEPIKKNKASKEIPTASTKLSLKPEEKVESISVSSLPEQPKQTFTAREINRFPVPLGPFLEEESLLTSLGEAKSYKVETEKKSTESIGKDVSATVGESGKKGIGGILGPESATAKETQVLPESLTTIQKLKESKLELIPQRRVVFYNPSTARDPFLPLTERQDMSFGEVPSPLFENLTLVGIIKEKEGNRALLEDKMGFGYILKSGDRIKNGYIIRVEDDRVIFHIEQYGGFQVMVLELNREY